MSADLHIHVAEEKDLKHVREFLRKTCSTFDQGRVANCTEEWLVDGEWKANPTEEEFSRVTDRRLVGLDYDEHLVQHTPNVWIGEVSWLKASLFEDESYIPPTVHRVADLVSNYLPIIDDKFIAQVRAAFDAPNTTGYKLAEVEKVVSFLEQHKGKHAYQISW